MAGKTLTDVVRDLGRAARLQAALALPDAQLLERFAALRDETAFEALLHRHGPLVFGVCRRLLYDAHDAEDAFQATFLVLARKAGAVGRRGPLGNWLYGVAYRVAARLRKHAARRRDRQQLGLDLAAVPAAEKPAPPDLAPLLHEEVQRLPDKYRRPVVLCYLEGRTNEEAADRLRWPVGTVKGRLHRARELLRVRLTRRGVALSAGTLTAGLAPAPAPAALLDATAQAALRHLAGGAVSAPVASLTKGVLQTMFFDKLKRITALLLVVAFLGGVGGFAYRTLAKEPVADPKDPPAPVVKAPAPGDKESLQGTWKFVQVQGGPTTKIRVEFNKWVITAGEISYGDGRAVYSYTLDPSRKPKTLDLKLVVRNPDGPVYRAIYELSGDMLKVRLPRLPEGERPATIEPDDAAYVYTFRRAKPEEAQPRDDRAALQGTWKFTKYDMPTGLKLDLEALDAWVIVGDQIIQVDGKNYHLGPTYKLDPSQKPKAIDLTYERAGQSDTVPAIYELDGDALKIYVPLKNQGRPTKLGAGAATLGYFFRRDTHARGGDDMKILQGTWTVRLVIAGGVDVSERSTEDDYGYSRGSKWVVAGDRLTLPEGKGEQRLLYTLDPDKNPKTIDLLDVRYAKAKGKTYLSIEKPEDHTLRGIYALDGDTWVLCLGGPDRPATFASKKGGLTTLVVLRREPRQDPGRLVGHWNVTEIRADGKDVTDEAGEPRWLAQAGWAVTPDKLTVRGADKTVTFAYRLDPDARPKAIDLTLTDGPADQKGKTRACVYALEGDTLKLCLPFEPGAKRPAEVAAREGEKTMLIELKRDPKDPAR